MISQITAAFAASNVNIENMANGSKGDVAYTIVETNDKANDVILNNVTAIDGVFKVKCY
jgi:D-3-phosphoglycerate dehydrogenase